MRKFLIPLLAVAGAVLALMAVFVSQKKPPTPPVPFPPPTSPYAYSIAGSGVIEASSLNVPIGCPFNEIVTKVFVMEGDMVKQGDPLFQLDTRAFESQLAVAQSNVELTAIGLENQKRQFSFYGRLQDRRSVSETAYTQASFSLQQAEENLNVAKANLAQIEVNIERSLIRASLDGEVLQVNVREGQLAPITVPFVPNQATSQLSAQGNIMLIGRVSPLHMRVDIDEDEAWKFTPGARATAFVRGNSHLNFEMVFERVEPFIVPKASFTGANIERVDTRVLQVLYRFERGNLPIYAGQILDVFIEATRHP